MADFPVAFMFFFEDLECSQALQFCHDSAFDIFDFYFHGFDVIGFVALGEFQACSSFCCSQNFRFITFQISFMHL